MYEIRNSTELKSFFNNVIIPELLQRVAEEAAAVIEKWLIKSPIKSSRMHSHYNTSSMHTYAKYVDIKNDKGAKVIYIDFDLMTTNESMPSTNVAEWGRFCNTYAGTGGFAGDVAWDGDLITLRLAKWLQGDASATGLNIGNQPLKVNNWYTNATNEIKNKLPSWVKKHLRKLLGNNVV